MSAEFEYRRLAGACLDLAKRTAIPTDKTRFLVIAEAWLDFADRVARKMRSTKRETADGAEHPLVTRILGSDEAEAREAPPALNAAVGPAVGPALGGRSRTTGGSSAARD